MKKLVTILLICFTTLAIAQPETEPISEVPVPASDIYLLDKVEVKPAFPGGIEKFLEFIEANFVMPKTTSLIGKVFVSFIVQKDGSLTDIKVVRDVGFGSGKEAIRVMKLSPKWSPGTIKGQPVKVLYTMPIPVSSKS